MADHPKPGAGGPVEDPNQLVQAELVLDDSQAHAASLDLIEHLPAVVHGPLWPP